jgi:hypothetical protein
MQYELKAGNELIKWQKKMQRKPSLINRMSKGVQKKINNLIPEKVHTAMTTEPPRTQGSLEVREAVVEEKIKFYRKAAAIEGGVTGAGGILMGLADFPLLLGIKLKMLFDIAAVYGFDVRDYKERVYLLYIFQLAFSSQEQRRKVYVQLEDWNKQVQSLPSDINQFDWRTFQQEYRDYIDIAKMAQLVPLIGAPVGVVVNYQLIRKLGNTAMNAYRMRWLKE